MTLLKKKRANKSPMKKMKLKEKKSTFKEKKERKAKK